MRLPQPRWLLVTLAFFGGILLVLFLTLKFWIEPVVEQAARLGLKQLDNSGYRISFKDLDLQPFRRQIVLHDVTIDIDSARRTQLLAEGSYVTGHLDKLEFHLHQYPYWESDRFLAVSSMALQQPDIQIHQSTQRPERDTLSLPTNAFELIRPYLDSLRIDAVTLREGQLARILYYDDYADTLKLPPVSWDIINIQLDSLAASTNAGFPSIKGWKAEVDTLHLVSKDSLYTYTIGRTEADLILGELVFSNIKIEPNYSKSEFAAHADDPKDRMEIAIALLKCEGLYLSDIWKEDGFRARTLTIDSPLVNIFKDKRFPPNKELKPLIGEMLRSVPLQFRIDTINVSSGRIVYEEQNPLSEVPGQVVFGNVFASVYGATNDTIEHATLQIDARAHLMDDGLLELAVQVPLNSADGRHSIKGRLGKMHLEELNTLLEPLVFASIRSGTGNLMDFEMDLDERAARGEVRFIYNDLKIDLLNHDHPDNPAVKEFLGTWLANWFVVKSDNPTRNQSLRIGSVHLERDPHRSIINYWCQGLLSGIKESIGMPAPKEPTASVDLPSDEPQKPGLLKRIFSRNRE